MSADVIQKLAQDAVISPTRLIGPIAAVIATQMLTFR